MMLSSVKRMGNAVGVVNTPDGLPYEAAQLLPAATGGADPMGRPMAVNRSRASSSSLSLWYMLGCCGVEEGAEGHLVGGWPGVVKVTRADGSV